MESLITVVLPVLNRVNVVEYAVKSILSQSYDKVELIVVDGGSTDGTLDILKKYSSSAKLITGPDSGIADAFNKGIKLAQGDYIACMNSDDILYPDALKIMFEAFKEGFDFVYGNVKKIDRFGKIECRVKSFQFGSKYFEYLFSAGIPFCHIASMVKKSVYDELGVFNCNYRVAMDYDFFLRVHLSGRKGVYIDEFLGEVQIGGISTNSLNGIYENHVIRLNNGINFLTSFKFFLWCCFKYLIFKLLLKLKLNFLISILRRLKKSRYKNT
jgi:glycosyltransferase involved in cell wall biosynthesis